MILEITLSPHILTSFFEKHWKSRGEKSSHSSLAEQFFALRGYSQDILKTPQLSDLESAKNLSDMDKALDRLFETREKKESLLIFGDFDLDGASGTAILYLTLKHLGFHVFPKLPSREEGYGLSSSVYDLAKKHNISLVVTVDCGSSNTNAVEYGNSLGIETIITDHHTLPKKHPASVALLHPHRGKKTDSTWDLTGAGVAFFLAKALLEHELPKKQCQKMLEQLLELAVLGTVADVGSLQGQNRIITTLGLEHMKKEKHPALSELMRLAKIDSSSLTAESIAFFIAPRLNAAGRLDHPRISLELLLGDKESAAKLESLNLQRREITADLCEVAEKEISPTDPCFVLFHQDFFGGVGGLIAARLAEKYHRPAVILSSKDENIATASARCPEDFHLAKALTSLSHLLEGHGGHQCAAGFSIQQKNIPAFRKAFQSLVEKERGKIPPLAEQLYDTEVSISQFFEKNIEDIFLAAPFGQGNPAPLFLLKNISLRNPRRVGADQDHLSFFLQEGKYRLSAIGFRLGKLITNDSLSYDILISPEISLWKGKRELKLKVMDMRRSEEDR